MNNQIRLVVNFGDARFDLNRVLIIVIIDVPDNPRE